MPPLNPRHSTRHNRKVQERFDDWAPDYDASRIRGWFRYFQAIALTRLEPFERLLDVGCGTGWAVGEATRRQSSTRAHGIDISDQMIREAEKKRASDRVSFCSATVEAIPFPDQTFDAVLCTGSFHHYGQPLAALAEIRRVMQSEGKLVLIDSARDVHPAIWLQDRLRRYLERGHVRYYTRAELRKLIEKSGLQVVNDIEAIRGFFHRKRSLRA